MGLQIDAPDALSERLSSLLAGSVPDGIELRCVYHARAALNLIRDLNTEEGSAAPVLVILGEMPTPFLARSLIRAAEGIVLEADLDHAGPAAVAALGVGLRVVPHEFSDMLSAPVLSAREKQVLAMVVLDMPNVQIAERLHVSESNVKFHLSSAFAKLGVRSRSAAAALVLDPDAGLGTGILRITSDQDDAR